MNGNLMKLLLDLVKTLGPTATIVVVVLASAWLERQRDEAQIRTEREFFVQIGEIKTMLEGLRKTLIYRDREGGDAPDPERP